MSEPSRSPLLRYAAALVVAAFLLGRFVWLLGFQLYKGTHDGLTVAICWRVYLGTALLLVALTAVPWLAGRWRPRSWWLGLLTASGSAGVLLAFLLWLQLRPIGFLALQQTWLSRLDTAGLLALITAVFWINALPDAVWERIFEHRGGRWGLGLPLVAAVGLADLLALRPLWLLCGRALGPPSLTRLASGLGAVVVMLGVLPTITAKAAFITHRIPMAPEVQEVFARPRSEVMPGQFYSIVHDPPTDRIIVTDKHNALWVFDRADPEVAPQVRHQPAAELENIDIDVQRRLAYHFDRGRNVMLELDLDSLRVQREAPLSHVFDGEQRIWSEYKKCANARITHDDSQLYMACAGSLLVVLDRQTLEPVGKLPIGRNRSAMILRPEVERLYLSYWRQPALLRTVDTRSLEVAQEVPAPRSTGWMSYAPGSNALYVAVPAAGRIHEYDADSLELRGWLPAPFGVRALALDEERGRIYAGSLVLGQVGVVDLERREIVARYSVAKWLRSLLLEPSGDALWVTSYDGLFRLEVP